MTGELAVDKQVVGAIDTEAAEDLGLSSTLFSLLLMLLVLLDVALWRFAGFIFSGCLTYILPAAVLNIWLGSISQRRARAWLHSYLRTVVSIDESKSVRIDDIKSLI